MGNVTKNYLLMTSNGGKTHLNFDEKIIKNHHKDSDTGYILDVSVKYPEHLQEAHNDITFLPQRKKSKSVKNLCVFYKTYAIHIKALRQALDHGLVPRRVHQVIEFRERV